MQGTPRNGKAGGRRVEIGGDGRKGRGHHENHVLQCDGPAGVGRG